MGSARYPEEGGGDVTLAELTADGVVSKTTLLAPATTIAVSGLGASDGDYEFYFHIQAVTGATGAVKLQVNGADTNLYSQWVSISGASTVVGARNATAWQVSPSLTAQSASGWGRIRSRPDPTAWRSGFAQVTAEPGPSGFNIQLLYTDAATVITSLRLIANTDTLNTGSFLMVRRLYNPS